MIIMANIFIFISLTFLFTFLVGHILEKFKIPWIFAALILGAILAIKNPFSNITSSESFTIFAQLGMYFLLFMIGFEIDIKKLRGVGSFIVKSTAFIIFSEGIIGSLLLHFIFGYGFFISVLVALSFATVGESVLIPILDEFKLTNRPLGQSIIGIGTMDDIIEIALLIIIFITLGSRVPTGISIGSILLPLVLIAVFTFGLMRFKEEGRKFNYTNIETIFLFILFAFFLFIGIGTYAHIEPLAALLAGISISAFIPEKRRNLVEKEIKSVAYGFFAPLFFLWVGAATDIKTLLVAPLLIIAVVTVSSFAKITSSYVIAKNKLGNKESILLGIGLSVRLSTGIIIIKILFDNALIDSKLYSVIVASNIIFVFLVPALFSSLVKKLQVT